MDAIDTSDAALARPIDFWMNVLLDDIGVGLVKAKLGLLKGLSKASRNRNVCRILSFIKIWKHHLKAPRQPICESPFTIDLCDRMTIQHRNSIP